MSGAGSEDQEVVGDFRIRCPYFFCINVYRLHFREHHFCILAFAQYRAHWRSDVSRRKRRCRHLIEKRLKKMVIGPVDHGDAHIFAGEFFRRLEPAKARSDYHDVWYFRRGSFHMEECSEKENRCENFLVKQYSVQRRTEMRLSG